MKIESRDHPELMCVKEHKIGIDIHEMAKMLSGKALKIDWGNHIFYIYSREGSGEEGIQYER